MIDINLTATNDVKKYYADLTNQINAAVIVATKARNTGKDVCDNIECLPAAGIAEKTELLTGPKGVAKIYNELWEKTHDRFQVTLEIFNMILDKKLGSIEDPEKRLDQAIRTALVIQTDGVVVSPLDGLPKIKISKNSDGSSYPDIYYAGPIRAAGGNAQTLPLLLADLAREKLHLDRYKPTDREIERYIEEALIYQTEIVARQERITEKEVRAIIENCPICINSGPDSDVEVVANRDIERIPTNRVRGAMCLVLIDGVCVRAMKIMKTGKKLGLNWSWLEKIIKIKKTSEGAFELKPSTKYIEGLAAGRPVFAHPFVPGGFRLRYGKARNTGLMAKAVNPATMYVLDEFIAVGTHGRIERPGKSLQFFPCDEIDGPIVLLKDKSVVKIDNVNSALKYRDDIEKILFVGDILIDIGDFKKSGHPLIKNGYVEEEWLAEIKYLLKTEKITQKAADDCFDFYKHPDAYTAMSLSINYNVPLFPKYIWYYDLLNDNELKELVIATRSAEKIFKDKKIISTKIEYNKTIKEILEKIGLPHKYSPDDNKIVIQEEAYPFLKVTGALNALDPIDEFNGLDTLTGNAVEKLSAISKIIIKNKSGTYIGARMGRPEAAHERIMAGHTNVLFPIGHGFGNVRDIMKIRNKKSDNVSNTDFGINDTEVKAYICPECKRIIFHRHCFNCHIKANAIRQCKKCKRQTIDNVCHICNEKTSLLFEHKVNMNKLIEDACKNLKIEQPESLKGVKGLFSGEKVAEPLEKGILRAKNEVYIFKDGTCRYEGLNATITQISAKEFGYSVERLRTMGYSVDYLGNELKKEDQRVSIFPQDIIVDDHCGEYFLKVSKFIDDLLEKFYGLPRFYNLSKKEDLIGQLVIAIAPHTSAGVVGRILGFSKTKLCWGHPYFITAKRRNVDGDQDSMLLLMDGLLNFSMSFLSNKSGGRMDAPLAFTTIINPFEIDDESHEIETVTEYPFELYQDAKNFSDPDSGTIQFVAKSLGTELQYNCIKYTHDTRQFDEGPKQSAYLQIKSMADKVDKQAKLQKRIAAVDYKDALERLLHYHLFPDIIGNTRAFARQKLRCVKCNTKYRRIPLSGKCKCGGKLILTIAEGSIRKYVDIARKVIIDYELKPYLLQRVNISEQEINSLFTDKDEKCQKSLSDFFNC